MNHRLLFLLIVISISGCSGITKPTPESTSGHGKLNAKQIGEVYPPQGPHPMIGLLDPRNHTAYVAEADSDRVKKALQVREATEATWMVEHPSLKGQYRVVPITSLDLHQPLFIGMAVVNKNSTCLKTAKGECSNMYDENDKFSYSWKAPKEIWTCEWTEKQDCTDILKEETIDVYQQKDCKGQATSQKQTIAFCTPA
jgi:hypothetical protein